jgi:hypothetical protein
MPYCDKLYVVDLDNTVYNTWPSLVCRPRGVFFKISLFHELVRVLRIPTFGKMLFLLRRRVSNKNIVFLSARHFYHYPLTFLRLMCDLRATTFKLILVDSVNDKTPIIAQFSSQFRHVVVIDDFSYGHELGTVLTYSDVLKDLRFSNVKIITGVRLARLQS